MGWDWLGYMIAVAAGVLIGEAHAATRTNRKMILELGQTIRYVADRLYLDKVGKRGERGRQD